MPETPHGVRRAGPEDLAALWALEQACYEPERRQSRQSIAHSLASPHQSVWLLDDDAGLAAALVLWHHAHTVRVYAVHVRPDRQGHGLGRRLLAHTEALARAAGARRIVLEADAQRSGLLSWYRHAGYRRTDFREDFYGPGRPAYRLEKPL